MFTRQRQLDGESRALPDLAVYTDAATVRADDPLGQRQPETGAALLAVKRQQRVETTLPSARTTRSSWAMMSSRRLERSRVNMVTSRTVSVRWVASLQAHSVERPHRSHEARANTRPSARMEPVRRARAPR
jgi:hypothetical protein